MSIIHVNQIRTRIESLFHQKIDLSDIRTTDNGENSQFLTRGLAAYVVCFLSGVDADVGALAVVDGSDDNGIDAIHFDPSQKILYLIQSKWIHDGRGEPANGDMKKFLAGVRDLFNTSFDRFNRKVKDKQLIIKQALDDPETTYQVVIAYTGLNELALPSQRDLDDLVNEINDPTNILTVVKMNQGVLHNSLITGVSGTPINLQIGLRSWGIIQHPYLAYYGQVNGTELASWWKTYRARLFARNLRSLLGDTEVNSEIRKTIDNDPENFWYFNNGITLTCAEVVKTMVGGSDRDAGTFHCKDVSIVNGAQTAASIGKYSESTSNNKIDKVFVPIRIISIGDSVDLADRITRSNNRQNRIENRDFVRQDPEQIRIRTELAIDKINYNIMRSEAAVSSQDSFDLIESTTALACASSKPHLVVQLKREIGKLWENLDKGPYKELFNPDVSGPYVWRCVQLQRLIDKFLSSQAKTLTGREYSILVHGNRMIAAAVFRSLDTNKLKDPNFNMALVANESVVEPLVNQAIKKLKDQITSNYGTAVIPTLFKNLTKCRTLFD